MKIAVVDIETTARSPEKGTIVEIGICMLDLESHFTTKLLATTCREQTFQTIFEERQLKNCWVFNNSDLTIDEILTGPSWEETVPKLNRIFEKFPATAYNKQFDLNWLRKHGATIPKELPCPMIAATPVLKLPGRYRSHKWPSVQEAWDFFFPEKNHYIEQHRAYDDAEHEAEIVYKLYESGDWLPSIE